MRPRQNTEQHKRLVRTILRWYVRQGRTLPWRNISNPYRVLLSEIMLQQTQVHRVLGKFPLFVRRFPTLRSLADSAQRDVVIAWQGMGYNNRAVRLRRLARIVMGRHKGKIPKTYDELASLPGIGRYTANAILAAVYQCRVPVVDVNVRRLFSRLFWRMRATTEMRSEEDIWNIAEKVLPRSRVYDWNQALMDLGATICTAREPLCGKCPAVWLCASSRSIRRTTRERKHEPTRNGIPNRIYRGRLVEILRKHNRRGLPFESLGNKIHPHYASRHRHWLEELVSGLEKDGLVRRQIRNGQGRKPWVVLA